MANTLLAVINACVWDPTVKPQCLRGVPFGCPVGPPSSPHRIRLSTTRVRLLGARTTGYNDTGVVGVACRSCLLAGLPWNGVGDMATSAARQESHGRPRKRVFLTTTAVDCLTLASCYLLSCGRHASSSHDE